ncbi:CLUMA_CG007270, isoform A [Clunio marinus]|uniref:CLUMA_CG007270, isoform A n=1 Tax=Clunio marinus TaxID=568069 RepID=A0A1J1I4E0_9DIPT|nr:CLUMA_CG007270, isoform A [Clunio marinus]
MNYHWIPSSTHQGLATGSAVYAGNDADGSPIYVGRAFHEGDQIPAKVIPSKQACYVSHNGLEHFKPTFEVLSGTGFTWVGSSNGHVPPGAVLAGNQSTGEPLYVGRAHHEGSLTVGKILQGHGCIYIPFNGQEHPILHYEVLVGQAKAQWVHASSHGPMPPNPIFAGTETDGSPIYIGRCFHNGDQLPAKVIPNQNVAYVTFDGQVIPKYSYEVLCDGNVQWVPSAHGAVLPNAVVGGRTSTGETLYIGRGQWMGSLTPGKIHPSHGNLYIASNGMECAVGNYEVLIEN